MCGKWLKYLTNGLNMWEMTQIYEKWLKHVRNGLSMWKNDLEYMK